MVTEEHRRESARLNRTSRSRRFERIQCLLAGESIDVTDLDYEIDGFHLGVVGTSLEVEGTVQRLASGMNLRLLSVAADDGKLWAWLGSRRPIEVPE